MEEFNKQITIMLTENRWRGLTLHSRIEMRIFKTQVPQQLLQKQVAQKATSSHQPPYYVYSRTKLNDADQAILTTCLGKSYDRVDVITEAVFETTCIL